MHNKDEQIIVIFGKKKHIFQRHPSATYRSGKISSSDSEFMFVFRIFCR